MTRSPLTTRTADADRPRPPLEERERALAVQALRAQTPSLSSLAPLLGDLLAQVDARTLALLRERFLHQRTLAQLAVLFDLNKPQPAQIISAAFQAMRAAALMLEQHLNALLSGRSPERPITVDPSGLRTERWPDLTPGDLWTLTLHLLRQQGRAPSEHLVTPWSTTELAPGLWLYAETADTDFRPVLGVLEQAGTYRPAGELLSPARMALLELARLFPALEADLTRSGTLIVTQGGLLGHRNWRTLTWLRLGADRAAPDGGAWTLSGMAEVLADLNPERFPRSSKNVTNMIGYARHHWEQREAKRARPCDERPYPVQPAGPAGHWRLNPEGLEELNPEGRAEAADPAEVDGPTEPDAAREDRPPVQINPVQVRAGPATPNPPARSDLAHAPQDPRYLDLPMPDAWKPLLAPYRPASVEVDTPASVPDDTARWLQGLTVSVTELGAALDGMLAVLSAQHRAVLLKQFVSNQTVEETAHALHITRERVRQLLLKTPRLIWQRRLEAELHLARLFGDLDRLSREDWPADPAATPHRLIADLSGLRSALLPGTPPEHLWTLLVHLTRHRGADVPARTSVAQPSTWVTFELSPQRWLYAPADAVTLRPVLDILERTGRFLHTDLLERQSAVRTLNALARLYPGPFSGTGFHRPLIWTQGGHLGLPDWSDLQWLTNASHLILPASSDWQVSQMASALAFLFPPRFGDLWSVPVGHMIQGAKAAWDRKAGASNRLAGPGERLPFPFPLVGTGHIGHWQLQELGDGYDSNRRAVQAILSTVAFPPTTSELLEMLGEKRRVAQTTLDAELLRPEYRRLGPVVTGPGQHGRPVWLRDRPLPSLEAEHRHVEALFARLGPQLPAEVVEGHLKDGPGEATTETLRRAGRYSDRYRVVLRRGERWYVDLPHAQLLRLNAYFRRPELVGLPDDDELQLALSVSTSQQRQAWLRRSEEALQALQPNEMTSADRTGPGAGSPERALPGGASFRRTLRRLIEVLRAFGTDGGADDSVDDGPDDNPDDGPDDSADDSADTAV